MWAALAKSQEVVGAQPRVRLPAASFSYCKRRTRKAWANFVLQAMNAQVKTYHRDEMKVSQGTWVGQH